MSALYNYSFVILRGANDQFDHIAAEQQRFETERSELGLGEMQQELKRAG